MPHYFFDLVEGNNIEEDKVGSDLTDVSAARERATALALAKVARLKTPPSPHDPRELHVRAAAGRHVAKIAFRYVSV